MSSSRILELKIKQAYKYGREHNDFDIASSILDSFCTVLNCPRAMGEELYEHFHANEEKLYSIIDLFNEDLESDEVGLFDEAEYKVLIDLVNRFASDLELERLQSIMQFFMDAGQLEPRKD